MFRKRVVLVFFRIKIVVFDIKIFYGFLFWGDRVGGIKIKFWMGMKLGGVKI